MLRVLKTKGLAPILVIRKRHVLAVIAQEKISNKNKYFRCRKDEHGPTSFYRLRTSDDRTNSSTLSA